ncbi:DMT family transporter [Pseudonocardia kongjuensis]|uniref:DMT family transporter n=1 Tax=Pseudonocardia kongjuensis TaxID=102227 RepID=A0ABP4IE35_9PSEU
MLAALGAVVLWSTNAYAAGVALAHMQVEWLLLVQYGSAAVVFLAVRLVAHRNSRRRTAGPRGVAGAGPWVLVVGVVGLTGTIFLQYTAFALAPIVAANVLAYGWPLLAALAVLIVRRDRSALRGAGLAVLGFAGVALIFISPGAADTGDNAAALGTSPMWGYVAALGSAVCMTAYTLGSGRVSVPVADLLLPATIVGVIGAAMLVAISGAPSPPLVGMAAAAYIGLGPMAAGYGLWTVAMSHGGARTLSPLGYATPLLSTTLLIVTGASATPATLLGIGLILASSTGVLLTQHRRSPTEVDRQPQPREWSAATQDGPDTDPSPR